MQKNRSSETVKFRFTFKADDDDGLRRFLLHPPVGNSSIVSGLLFENLIDALISLEAMGLMSVYLFTPNRVAGRDQVMMELLNL